MRGLEFRVQGLVGLKRLEVRAPDVGPWPSIARDDDSDLSGFHRVTGLALRPYVLSPQHDHEHSPASIVALWRAADDAKVQRQEIQIHAGH